MCLKKKHFQQTGKKRPGRRGVGKLQEQDCCLLVNLRMRTLMKITSVIRLSSLNIVFIIIIIIIIIES